jgi:hypothetical protein
MEEGVESLLDVKGLGAKSLEQIVETLENREVASILGREPIVVAEEPEPEPEPEEPEPAAEEEEEAAPVEAVAEEEAALEEPVEDAPPTDEVIEEEEAAPPVEEIPVEVTPAVVEAEELQLAEEEPPIPVEPEPIPVMPGDKPPGRKKKRAVRKLVYDETLGEVVAKKVRKPKRRREEWEEAAEDWQSYAVENHTDVDVDEEDDEE